MDSDSLWVFGYGSLLWMPGFQFTNAVEGVVRGYSRRFWQGNTTHRGTPGKPGRVATLVEDKEGEVWGIAYEVANDDALPYLNNREVKLGGYRTEVAQFYPRTDLDYKPFPILLYSASPENHCWLGDAPDEQIAEQIVTASGPSGHNVEYLLRMAEFMRDRAPYMHDEHLFNLEDLVRRQILLRQLRLSDLMGPEPPALKAVAKEDDDCDEMRSVPGPSKRFTDTLCDTQLRCLRR